MQDYGLVSVVMPTYNCQRFIEAAIQSVEAQTYPHWELIVVDDGSTDDTQSVVARMHDARIRYFRNAVHSGVAKARNFALRKAQGRWIAFLDSDDLWKTHKLERQLAFMTQHRVAFSYHQYEEISEDGQPLGIYVSGLRKVSVFHMYACCWPGCLTVMYDREVMGLIQIRAIERNNDTAMWLRAVRVAPCYLLPENLAQYRRRELSLTPKLLYERILAHYPLFRVAEAMNPVCAIFWTLMNVAGNAFKKVFYVRHS
jgi:glycosyltransferase involved in cell wall biosynthesis